MIEVLRQIGAMFAKELLVEFRSPARITGLFFFALALLLMVAFASPSEGALRDMAGGTLWIGLLIASTRSMDQSWSTEIEHDAAEGLLLWPVEPVAIFYGKALTNTVVLLVVAVALFPLLVALYDVQVRGSLMQLFGLAALGCGALAAPGTLYGLIVARARGSSVLMPLLLFPLVVPALLAASRGTTVVLEGDPMLQGSSWFALLGAFNVIHWTLNGLLFGRVLEDG